MKVVCTLPPPGIVPLIFESWEGPGGSRRGTEVACGGGHLTTRKEKLIFNNLIDLVWTMGRLITKHTRTSFSPFSSLLIQLVSLFLKLSPSSTTWLSDFTHSSNSLTALSLIIISVLKTRC